jgi:hypothetical protein
MSFPSSKSAELPGFWGVEPLVPVTVTSTGPDRLAPDSAMVKYMFFIDWFSNKYNKPDELFSGYVAFLTEAEMLLPINSALSAYGRYLSKIF